MGQRGEIWVLAQATLLIIFSLAPPIGVLHFDSAALRMIGWLLSTAGIIVLAWSASNLGRSLTPFPRPTEKGKLVTTGAYRFVRHPIYFGVIMGCLGISLVTFNLFRLYLTLILFVFFDMKATREERWLVEQYIDYLPYKRRVKKLIPWIY